MMSLLSVGSRLRGFGFPRTLQGGVWRGGFGGNGNVKNVAPKWTPTNSGCRLFAVAKFEKLLQLTDAPSPPFPSRYQHTYTRARMFFRCSCSIAVALHCGSYTLRLGWWWWWLTPGFRSVSSLGRDPSHRHSILWGMSSLRLWPFHGLRLLT